MSVSRSVGTAHRGGSARSGSGGSAGEVTSTTGLREIVLVLTIGLIFHAFMHAGQPEIMSEMFPTRMRYSGVSLGYQITSIIAGWLAPIIASALLQQYKSWVPVAIYIAIACVITAGTVLSLRETRGPSLRDVDSEDARKHGPVPVGASSAER
jgi:MFS family permease